MVRSQLWFSEQVPVRDGQKQPVYSISVSPDGTKFLASMGSRVHLYSSENGSLITVLKNHTQDVYTVCWGRNSDSFATGGADKIVILYNSENHPSLRYSHDSSIQYLVQSPIEDILVSCSNTDFGIHSPDYRVVQKTQVASKIITAAFSADGQYFALGMLDGTVSIRNTSGKEETSLSFSLPISSLAFSPNVDAVQDRLVVGTADQKLHLYTGSGAIVLKTPRNFEGDPCAISFSPDGKCLFVTGSNRKVYLYTRELVLIDEVADISDWGWSLGVIPSTSPNTLSFLVGSNDGTLSSFIVQIPVVHSLFADVYASRDGLTSVSITPLSFSSLQFSLNLKDFVKKVAVGPQRLLVQTTKSISLFEIVINSQSEGPATRLLNVVHKPIDCSLLAVTSDNIIACKTNLLDCYSLDGSYVRSWKLPGHVRYVRLLKGPIGKESLLIGCKTGHVVRIFVNSSVLITVLKHHSPIRCLDLSPQRTKLAVVDDKLLLTIYDVSSGKTLAKYSEATSVSFNTRHSNMLAFSCSNNEIKVSTNNQTPHSHRSNGFVIGFIGSKIFVLRNSRIFSLEVPHSWSISTALQQGNTSEAITLARMGATEEDWYKIGRQCLCNLDISMARRCFIRISNPKMLLLTDKIASKAKILGFRESELKQSFCKNIKDFDINNESVASALQLQAETLAYFGDFQGASRIFESINRHDLSVDLYSDLCRWSEVVNPTSELLIRQGKWDLENGKTESAIELFKKAGDYSSVVSLLTESNQYELLYDLASSIPTTHTDVIRSAASALSSVCFDWAASLYSRIGEMVALLELQIINEKFKEAFTTFSKLDDVDDDVYFRLEKKLNATYASSLVDSSEFDLALSYMRKSGQSTEIKRLINDLIDSSVSKCAYSDVSYYYFLYSQEVCYEARSLYLNGENSPEKDSVLSDLLEQNQLLSTQSVLYYCFNFISEYIESPFTSVSTENLFHMCVFSLNLINSSEIEIPKSISLSFILFSLLKISKSFSCFKTVRSCLDLLHRLLIPAPWTTFIDCISLHIRAAPFADDETYCFYCFRCGAKNSPLSESGDCCSACGCRFFRSRKSFRQIPILQFYLEDGISDSEALNYLEEYFDKHQVQERSNWTEDVGEEVQTLQLENNLHGHSDDDVDVDHFTRILLTTDPSEPLLVDRSTLKALPISEILSVTPRFEFETTSWFKIFNNESVVCCNNCCSFFFESEMEIDRLETGICCYCRSSWMV
ncbi:hypothetical protein P9112_008734 [Eukaryota sp. TZLM1-RC]